MFTHLHTHSTFSFLHGLSSPQALVDAAVQDGMPALALTDHHSLTGSIEFYTACLTAGIQPILGLEVICAPPTDIPSATLGTLVLLAMDMSGWRSLCRICSSLDGEAGALPFDRLAQETTGVICLTGGTNSMLNGLVTMQQPDQAQSWLNRLNALFPGQLYVELTQHSPEDEELNTRLAALAHRSHIPVVAAHQIYYLTPDQSELQRVVTAIRLNQPLSNIIRKDATYCVSTTPTGATTPPNNNPADMFAPPQAFFTSQAVMGACFARFPAAIERTLEIADRCRLELPLGVSHFPEIPLPRGVTALQQLRQKAESGARQRYHPLTKEVASRLEHELEVIGECGYAPLFLIVEQILNHARQQGVPISSRGSAASSLVAHCLGITSPDPLRLNLYFERFLNPARATPPDIDTDLCPRRRESVIRYVYDAFGADRVATVCTINRFRSRSALREVAKAYGLPPEQVSRLAESLPNRWYGKPGKRSGGIDP